MSEVPDLGPVPQRIAVSPAQARALVADQFPEFADLPVEPVAAGGWDNWTFHLGSELTLRLPSAAEYARAVDKEHRWLPRLAPDLPVPIPVPVAQGRPGAGYPYPWSILRWLPGETTTRARIDDPIRFATELADFVVALRAVVPDEGPRPGIHNWFRGGTLRTFDATVQDALRTLRGRVDVDRAAELWTASLGAPWDGVDRWFHGDLAAGNLLLRNGRLSAVIDFGTCGVGDPSCDLAVAWTLLDAPAREVFRDRLGVDAESWVRGRGWALWKALATCAATCAGDDPEDRADCAEASRVLDEILRPDR